MPLTMAECRVIHQENRSESLVVFVVSGFLSRGASVESSQGGIMDLVGEWFDAGRHVAKDAQNQEQ
jgi:hypothetical protein